MPTRLSDIPETNPSRMRLSDIPDTENIDNEYQIADEAYNVSEEFKIPLKDTMSFVAAPEPSVFGKALRTVREYVREKTGMFEPPIYGEQYREEKPLRTAAKISAYYGASYLSGVTGTALDILANKTKGDKTFAESIARMTGFEPTPEEEKKAEAVQYFGVFKPAGRLIRPLVSRIPAAKALKTILESGLMFSSVDAAVQFSKQVTTGQPIDWSRVHAAGGVGVLWGTGEIVVEAAMTGLIKEMDKYWGEKGMDVASKLRQDYANTGRPIPTMQEQIARQNAEIRKDIATYKTTTDPAVKQAIRDKYHGTNIPKDSAFAKPEPVETGKTGEITKPTQAATEPQAAVVPTPAGEIITNKADTAAVIPETGKNLLQKMTYEEIDQLRRVDGKIDDTKTKQLAAEMMGNPSLANDPQFLAAGGFGSFRQAFNQMKEQIQSQPPAVSGQETGVQPTPTQPTTPPVKPQAQEGTRLPGGRQAGGTTIIPDVAAEIATISKKLYKNPAQMTADIAEILKRNTKSAKTHIGTLGSAGKKLSDSIEKIDYRKTKRANTDEFDTRKLYQSIKNTKANRELVSKVVNSRIPKDQIPTWAIEPANKLRDILDRAMNEATSLGMQRKVEGKKILVAGSGKAFPQVPNEKGIAFLEEAFNKGKASAKVFSWANEQVKLGHYDNVDMAIKALQNYRDSFHRGLNPYLEMSRVELPEDMIEWDGAKILPGLYERNWMTVEGVREWGNEFEKAHSLIEQIKIKYGAHEAKRVSSFIETSFGKMSDASKETQQISNLVRAYQFQTKVGLSPLTILRNMLDRIAKGFTISPTSTIKTFIDYPPFINQFIESSQRLEEEMIKMGAVFSHGSISEGYEAGNILTELTSSPFTASERGNQVTIALTQMHKLYNDIQALKSRNKLTKHIFDKVSYIWGGGKGQIEYRLKTATTEEIFNKIQKGEELTQDEIGYVLHKAVKEKAFPMIMSTKPLWYDNHPFIKAMAQFKTWPVRQLNMVWQDVVKYTFKTGDVSRLLAFLTGTLIVGETYNILRDFLFDKRESLLAQYFDDEEEKDYARAILNDMLDGGLVGMLADFSYGIKDWVTGVSARTGKNLWDTGNYIAKSPKLTLQALERLLTQEVTPYRQIKAQVDKLDRWLVNENNITKEYTRWRAEGWEWYNNKQNPTLRKKIMAYTDDVINGKVDYGIGEDTLAYELASRQIIVGDIEDAAEYIVYILTNSDKPIDTSITNIKRSMNNRSPLGKVAEKDRDKFFRNYSVEEKAEAIKINKMYMTNYQQAISLAKRKIRNK